MTGADQDGEESFEAALLAFEAEQSRSPRAPLRVGEKVEGTILSIGGEFAFVEIGAKAEGQVAVTELRDSEGSLAYDVGDTLEALITAKGPDGVFLLRVRPGAGPVDGEELREAHRHGIPVEGLVTAINKGGAEVDVGGLRAFCPLSQLADRFVEDPSQLVQRRLRFHISRFEESGPGRRPNVVLSRRTLLEEERRRQAEETRARLEVGAVVKGEVRSIRPFGAFVDLGGLEGLLHVSQMSHGRVEDPGDVVSVGEVLEVQVLAIEPDPKGRGERISLSMRSLQQDPWLAVGGTFPVGTTASGRVTRVESFGAFVELAPGVEGLVHVSEIGAVERVQQASDLVSPGQDIVVRVLDVDTEKRRLSLSIGAATAAAAARDQAAALAELEESGRDRRGGLGSMADTLSRALQGSRTEDSTKE